MNPTHLRGPRTAQRALPGADRPTAKLQNSKRLKFCSLQNIKNRALRENPAYNLCQQNNILWKYNGLGASSVRYHSDRIFVYRPLKFCNFESATTLITSRMRFLKISDLKISLASRFGVRLQSLKFWMTLALWLSTYHQESSSRRNPLSVAWICPKVLSSAFFRNASR